MRFPFRLTYPLLVARTTCCPGGRRPQEVTRGLLTRSLRKLPVTSCALRAPGQQVVRATNASIYLIGKRVFSRSHGERAERRSRTDKRVPKQSRQSLGTRTKFIEVNGIRVTARAAQAHRASGCRQGRIPELPRARSGISGRSGFPTGRRQCECGPAFSRWAEWA